MGSFFRAIPSRLRSKVLSRFPSYPHRNQGKRKTLTNKGQVYLAMVQVLTPLHAYIGNGDTIPTAKFESARKADLGIERVREVMTAWNLELDGSQNSKNAPDDAVVVYPSVLL